MIDYLVVGSGLYGSVLAYRAKSKGKSVLVLEKRDHVGGNVYCETIEGINVHKYGAHIFHTNNNKIWDFVNNFVSFNRYTNSPLVNYKGHLLNLPFNMNTFYQMWGVTTPEDALKKLNEQRHDIISLLEKSGVVEPRNLEEQALLLVGHDIYYHLVKGYTEKQWGRECKDLPAFIIRRLPLRLVFDNNYFNDRYQGIPIGGYNKLIEGLLEGVEIHTKTDFFDNRSYWESKARKIVFTGQIDEFFDYCYGHLNYRTVTFETELLDVSNYQGNAVINFADREIPFTRIIEHKHFEMFGQNVYDCPKTVISREYPVEWKNGMEPFYPINDNHNNMLYSKYYEMTTKEENVIFGGRLAEYKYYDMDVVIEKALTVPLS